MAEMLLINPRDGAEQPSAAAIRLQPWPAAAGATLSQRSLAAADATRCRSCAADATQLA